MHQIFETILKHLPLHAEEGPLRETIPEQDLIAALGVTGIGDEASTLLVATLRYQFISLALFDRVELAKGRWAFVSFPASLLGRSLLETWSAGHALLAPDYWEQGDHRPVAVKEEQRKILHRIEGERLRQNPDASPVRVVHVAWGVIRLGEKFLFHRREDRDRPGEKTHVLPGGRFNPSDLPSSELSAGAEVLRELFDPESRLVDSCLDTTLARELEEELGLCPGEHYTFERWQSLPSYRDLAGTGNRHAFTEYAFQLYTVKLTPVGEVRLLETEAISGNLAWFSIADLAAPRCANGSSAYVNVLHASWGENIASQLHSVPESSASLLAMSGESQMLDLPAAPDAAWAIGKPGKERRLSMALGEAEWQLLLLLGWHARGFRIHASDCVRLLGNGWIRLDTETVSTLGQSLLVKTKTELPLIEIREACYLRLSIEPDILMFCPSLFTYTLVGDVSEGGMLSIIRDAIRTPWGLLEAEVSRQSINRNAFRILRALEEGEDPVGRTDLLANDWERNLRQQLLPKLRKIGLRKFWITENKCSSLIEGIRQSRSADRLE